MALTERRLALARVGIGASEVASAMGLDRFTSEAELASRKRGEMPPFEGNRFTLWGTHLEPVVVAEFLRVHRERGEKISIFTPPTIAHATCEVLFATADRIVVPEGRRARETWIAPVEAKNVSAYRRKEFSEDVVPEAMMIQVQTQLEVLGLPRAWLCTLVGGNEWKEYPIVRDPEFGRYVVEYVERWWANHVVQGLPVTVGGSEAATDFLKRRYPQDTLPDVPITPERVAMAHRLRQARENLKAAEEQEAAAANAIQMDLGRAGGVEGLLTWRKNKDSIEVDWEAVARRLAPSEGQLQEIVAAHSKPKPGARPLRLLKEAP